MSIQKIVHVVTPTLVICGTNDTLVPPAMAMGLFSKCGAILKRLEMLNNGGHDDTWTCVNYYPTIQQFLANVPSLPEDSGPFFDETTHNPSIDHSIVHIV